MTNVKYTLEKVKNCFEKSGYSLISTHYTNAHTKLETVCPNGHTYFVKFYCFNNAGNRCTECSKKRRLTYEEVKKLIEKEDYKLISKEYVNCMTKLDLLCPQGHTYSVKLNSFISGKQRCSTCSGVRQLTTEEISNFFKNRNEILLTTKYKNNKQKLDIICSKGHPYKITYNAVSKLVQSCSLCYTGPLNKKKTIEEIEKILEREGYKLSSNKYDGMHIKIDLICSNNHIYNVKMSDFVTKKSRCVHCSLHGISKEESDLLNWVKQFYPNADKKRFYYDPKNKSKHIEYDIYIPELKLGIEYNGLIWHSERFSNKNKSYKKMMWGNNNGIRVITVFQDEWLERPSQVKNFLISVFNKNTIRLGARDTTVAVLDKKQASVFLNEHHIQGSTNVNVCLGLLYDNELVAVITGSKHHRQNNKGVFVLNRLVFKANYSIAGGASKLLNRLIKYAQEYGYYKLISWSDNRWSEGRVYEKMGFVLEETSRPDYSYVIRNKRLSKQSCQKKHLRKKGAKGRTEREMALSLNLYRIWDCGKKRWAINL